MLLVLYALLSQSQIFSPLVRNEALSTKLAKTSDWNAAHSLHYMNFLAQSLANKLHKMGMAPKSLGSEGG